MTELILVGIFVYLVNLYFPDAAAFIPSNFYPRYTPDINPGTHKPVTGSSASTRPGFVKPPVTLEMEKPASMSQDEYSNLTKAQRRQLVDPKGRDRSVEIDNYPRLEYRFNQVYYKMPKHGGLYGLPLNEKGKVAKTEANAIHMRDSMIESAKKSDTIWYLDGQYQGLTPLGCDSINLYDPEANTITVFLKQPDGSGFFLTTCEPTEKELDYFKKSNGNFLTEKMIDQQKAVSTDIQLDQNIININTNNDEIQ